MIWDYIEEFLKRFYKNEESDERVPKFASFYKNYLKFFCVPTFKDIKFHSEKNNLNINQNSDKENKEENSQDVIQNISDDEKENVNKNNLIEEYKINENLNKCLNKDENKDSSKNKENIKSLCLLFKYNVYI